ncbi:MAG: hypothetical protein BWY88_01190 [Synergistetes bacterium ADurb.Bin520]|nr:MAG: hypothetical protein BWY88_01190 [Synergistetes bacterium ADurb.Bin520]
MIARYPPGSLFGSVCPHATSGRASTRNQFAAEISPARGALGL